MCKYFLRLKNFTKRDKKGLYKLVGTAAEHHCTVQIILMISPDTTKKVWENGIVDTSCYDPDRSAGTVLYL
jgi:hypothetical protein